MALHSGKLWSLHFKCTDCRHPGLNPHCDWLFCCCLSVWLEAIKPALKHMTSSNTSSNTQQVEASNNKTKQPLMLQCSNTFEFLKQTPCPHSLYTPSPLPLLLSRVTGLRIVGVLIRRLQPRRYKWQPGPFLLTAHVCPALTEIGRTVTRGAPLLWHLLDLERAFMVGGLLLGQRTVYTYTYTQRPAKTDRERSGDEYEIAV